MTSPINRTELRSGVRPDGPPDAIGVRKQRWSQEEKQRLFEHYPAIPAKRMTELLAGRTETAIYRAAFQFGVRKNHDRLVETGRENVSKRKDRQCFVEPPPVSS